MKDFLEILAISMSAAAIVLGTVALAYLFTVGWTMLFAWIAMHVWNTGISQTFEIADATYK